MITRVGSEKIKTEISCREKSMVSVCDGLCEKAWGISSRPRIEFNPDDPDDIAFLADHEVGEAPRDPGTYEGGEGKPFHPKKHNKWCLRECERCDFGTNDSEYIDFNHRRYNQPWKHEGDINA